MPLVKIISGPRNSGKTTEAKRIAQRFRTDGKQVLGFISEAEDSSKQVYNLVNIGTGEILPAVSSRIPEGSADGVWENYAFSRYFFNVRSFGQASASLLKLPELNSEEQPAAVIIDELGPLELDGRGFFAAAKEMIVFNREKDARFLLILVVREKILEQMTGLLELEDSEFEIICNPQDQ